MTLLDPITGQLITIETKPNDVWRSLNDGFDWRDPVDVEWRFQMLLHRDIVWC